MRRWLPLGGMPARGTWQSRSPYNKTLPSQCPPFLCFQESLCLIPKQMMMRMRKHQNPMNPMTEEETTNEKEIEKENEDEKEKTESEKPESDREEETQQLHHHLLKHLHKLRLHLLRRKLGKIIRSVSWSMILPRLRRRRRRTCQSLLWSVRRVSKPLLDANYPAQIKYQFSIQTLLTVLFVLHLFFIYMFLVAIHVHALFALRTMHPLDLGVCCCALDRLHICFS